MGKACANTPVRVGVLDGGVATKPGLRLVKQAAFGLEPSGVVATAQIDTHNLAHGTGVARIIAAGACEAEVLSAQVFRSDRPGIPAVVAAGLDWLVEHRVRIVNMSFGLLHDREVLRTACRSALASQVMLVASSPAQGRTVFPAGYPGVIRVTGDARCAAGEFSWLANERADFGACVGGPAHRPHQAGGGASFAAAHFSGALANVLPHCGCGTSALWALRRACRYTGRERRRDTVSGPVGDACGDAD